MKILVAAALLLAFAVPAHAATCIGRVKIDVATVSEGLRIKGDRIVYVDDCTFVNPDAILRKCPAGSHCRVEGGDEEDGAIEKVISVTRIDPYKEGVRDYREGLCFRARPYIDHGPEQELWIKGYHAHQTTKIGKRNDEHCHPGSFMDKHK